MKNFLMFSVLLLISTGLNAQNVGINATGAVPVDDAILDINSANKGLLIPRVNIANLATIAPVTGGATTSLLVYNTNAATGLGYYYWDGNDWNTIGSPSNNNLLAVNGTSINNIWVLDDNNGIFNWNGSSWNEIAPPNISNLRDILVFGNAIVLGGGWEAPIIAISSNSGSSWNVENAPCSGSNCSHGFKDMDGTDIDNIWVATGSTTNNGEQGIYQYNGVSWNHQQLYNTQCISVINTMHAFSTYHGDIGSWSSGVLEHINGVNASNLFTSSYWGYTPIYAISSNEVWFGSDKIYKYDGYNWNEETGLIGNEIKIINMLNSNEGYAVTGSGKILKR